ncbi:MAG: ribonuclease R [Trueperaceae bacterium]|nr:ribonuclease R [Trueperaceae bacterium]
MQTNQEIDKDQLFQFFKQNPEKPWHLQELQKRLKIKNRTPLRHALGELVDEGKLIRTRRRSYGLPQEMNLIIGRLQVTSGGYGFVIPETKEKTEDLFIPAENLAGAWDGDRVVARPNPTKRANDRTSGEIVRILQRRYQQIVGTLEYAKGYAILRPDSPKLRERILLLPDSVGQLDAGTRIVVTMHWPEVSGENDPFGEVTEILGNGDNPEIETKAVIIKYDLKDDFDAETLEEARAVPPAVTGEMREGRSDLRQISSFTIDGEDAKDFDDAISLERLDKKKDGLLRVGIHIADVSYYVAEGTNLDKEAKDRATSVYLPGQVLPMLPEELSNGICSLVEGQPRLTLSVLVDISRKGEVKSYKVKETVIESKARLTYEQVQAFAEGEKLPRGKGKLGPDLKVLIDLTQSLREQRFAEGALDFDFTEARVDVHEGDLELKPIRSNLARQLIEELMLLANRLVAKELASKDIPALFRVHEDPSEEKLANLHKALNKLGYTLDPGKTSSQDLQQLLKQVAGKPEANMVSNLLLRSMKQARYSAENIGHFGLAFDYYLHFTSPIRRYPDLVVHRTLRASLQHRLSPTLKERMRSDFPQLAEYTSSKERMAEDAERDLTKYYHARWASEHVGESFPGIISGVTNFGIFVSLPNGVEGRIHVSQLDDDYYMYLEDSMMLLGKHTRKTFKLGEKLEIKILASQAVQRQIDLIPAYMEVPEPESEEETEYEAPPKQLRTPLRKERKEPEKAEVSLKAKAEPKEKTPKQEDKPEPAQTKKRRKVLIFGDPNKWK